MHREALGGQTGTRHELQAQEHPGLGSGQERRGPGATGGGVSCGQRGAGGFSSTWVHSRGALWWGRSGPF